MTERPAAVTYIGWFWRVGGVAGMVVALPMAYWGKDIFEAYGTPTLLGLSPLVLFLWTFLGSFLCVMLGYGILKGRNWARLMAVIYCVAATLIAVWLYRGHPTVWPTLIMDVAFTGIMGSLLYWPTTVSLFFRNAAMANRGTSIGR